MKFQAFVEQVADTIVYLSVDNKVIVLPRSCLPKDIREADVVDVVVFINEKETKRQLDRLRHWLKNWGTVQAQGIIKT